MIAALPLAALPVIIHLIHRNRHRSIPWAATMFLRRANRMNQGMARLRYLLILLARILAVAALVVAVSRPLVSGKLGGLGLGKPDVTLIVLDRSASMETRDIQSGISKRLAGLKKLQTLLDQRGYGNELLLVESAGGELLKLESPENLLELPMTQPTATAADIPALLETCLAYLKANEVGRADVWICSDLRGEDWASESGRWQSLKEAFSELKGVHHFLLAYGDSSGGNFSIQLENVSRRVVGDGAELTMDVHLHGEEIAGGDAGDLNRRVPVEIEINGVRTVVEMDGKVGVTSLLGHSIPLGVNLRSGWGLVRLPEDPNPMDNEFYFVFSEPPPRNAVVVSDDRDLAEVFRMALAVPMAPSLVQTAEWVSVDRVAGIDWASTSMLVWQAPLPEGAVAEAVQRFVASGRVVVFFPPEQSEAHAFLGLQWAQWEGIGDEANAELSWWRNDGGLLGRVGNGDPLPLSDLRVDRVCPINALENAVSLTPMARLGDDRIVWARAATEAGGVYFCATLPIAPYSSMERDAVAFYVILQRALMLGGEALSPSRLLTAGPSVEAALVDSEWVAPKEAIPLVSQRPFVPGVYRGADSWLAVNRDLREDVSSALTGVGVDVLFAGLPYQRIDDAIGDTSSLASEVWRWFLYFMAGALVLEAILCLPPKTARERADRTVNAGMSRSEEVPT